MLNFESFDYFENLLALSFVAVPIFYAVRSARARRLLLGFTGLYLITLIAPRLTIFYVAFWLVVFTLQHLVSRWPDESRWIALTLSIIVLLAPMVIWKTSPTWFIVEFNLFFNDAVESTSAWFGAIDRVRDIILPIGLSFATFRAIDLLIKIHYELSPPLSPTTMFAFGFFPPVQVIGPVIEVTEVQTELGRAEPASFRGITEGIMLIGVGLAKVFVISYALEPARSVLNPNAFGSTAEFWIELFRFAFYFYFNFSGFSDIAIGAALLFGFRLKPNFNNPFVKTNPQAFWNSWHMSLSHFAQRNVFVPLGGMRKETQYPALMATIMAIALCHDLTIPLVFFGLYHGAGLVLHRMLADRRPPREGLALHVAKSGALFVFFCLSLPLLLMQLADLPGFYGNLIGADW